MPQCKAKIRLWLENSGGDVLLGPGKVEFLGKVEEYRSITRAARAMKMSYKKAWDMSHDLNRFSDKPFIEIIQGGKGGGGARLTEAGKNAVKSFLQLHGKMSAILDKTKIRL